MFREVGLALHSWGVEAGVRMSLGKKAEARHKWQQVKSKVLRLTCQRGPSMSWEQVKEAWGRILVSQHHQVCPRWGCRQRALGLG